MSAHPSTGDGLVIKFFCKLEARGDSLVLGRSSLLIEDLSLCVIFPRLLLRQCLLHSTIIVTAISIATVAKVTETAIPAVSNDPWLVACGAITLVVGEGERLIDATMVEPSCSEEIPVVADGETVFVGEVSVCSGEGIAVIS